MTLAAISRWIQSLALSLALSAPMAADEAGEEDVYLAPETFISDSFDGAPPKPQVLWLTQALKPTVANILGHDYPAVRVRYWRRENRSAWILDEIGKVKPITTGIVVEDGKITRLKVLVYRETHGWEVKYPFFTDQFKNTELDERNRLSRKIDGISGATLSVSALERLGRLALFFHQAINPDPSPRDEQ